MPYPKLTFFCELESESLQRLFQDPEVIQDLLALGGTVSLSIQDFSAERAETVRRLNEAGIPVTAWLLLPKELGYYFNIGNYAEATYRYQEFYNWTVEQGLRWQAVGLDIEPDLNLLLRLAKDRWRTLVGEAPLLVMNALRRRMYKYARNAYKELVEQIHADGYPVETYQFPVLADERMTRSTLLQRLTGIVDVPADREVWMLYSSYSKQRTPGYLWSYAPQAQAIGVGSTGGAKEEEAFNLASLEWDELARDLRLAWYWSDWIYIFSLEGCVRQGFLKRMQKMAWDKPILFPTQAAEPVNTSRRALQGFLWFNKNALIIFSALVGSFVIVEMIRRYARKRRT